jgi:hypothetical protein
VNLKSEPSFANPSIKKRFVSRDTSLSMTIRYELDGLVVESRLGVARISVPAQTDLHVHPISYTMSTCSTGVKAAGAWRWPHTYI